MYCTVVLYACHVCLFLGQCRHAYPALDMSCMPRRIRSLPVNYQQKLDNACSQPYLNLAKAVQDADIYMSCRRANLYQARRSLYAGKRETRQRG